MERGSGIGLTLVKEYLEMHQGNISLQSSVGKGTRFTFTVPLGRSHFAQDYIRISPEDDDERLISRQVIPKSLKVNNHQKIKEETTSPDPNKFTVLLVEDDLEMMDFVRLSLKDKYNFITAENGEIGLNKLYDHTPDLIVSDIMMPGRNGISLCQEVKDNPKTNHIPVILLASNSKSERRIEGIKSGADDYIAKPFEVKYLEARIDNLLNRQHKLEEHIKMDMITQPSEVNVSSKDEKFLKNLMDIIEKNISDPGLNINKLCEITGLSHPNLYRKVKNITGETVNELIRNIRIKRSAQLLSSKKLSISEVMYEVGFSNHSYFSKCFKKVYKESPKQYQRKWME